MGIFSVKSTRRPETSEEDIKGNVYETGGKTTAGRSTTERVYELLCDAMEMMGRNEATARALR